MDRILQAPADVDMDEASRRKRARIEARRKFRIVTRTIVAAGRFRFVLDVEAEQPEQAESEIIAAFGALEVQSSSGEMVDSTITGNQRFPDSSAGGKLISEPNSTIIGSFPTTNHGCCSTGRGVSGGGKLTSEPNSTNIGSFLITDQGYCTTGLGDGTALSDLFSGTDENPRSSPEWPKEGKEWPLPSLEMFQELEGYPADEDSPYSAAGLPDTESPEFSISEYLLSLDNEEAKEKATPANEGRMLINEDDDATESGQYAQERQESSEESLQNLWKIEENSEDWRTMVTELNKMITKLIQDLESGSGLAKVHKLGEDAREITKKIETPGSTSEANRFRASNSTIRDAEQNLRDILERLQAHIHDLSQNVHGRQRQLQLLSSMSTLIANGRKALQKQGNYTTTVSQKLDNLVKQLKFREQDVEKYLNKCAASITTLVQSALEKEKKNFTSVSSVRKWYSDEMSTQQSLPDFSSSSDPYPFLPVL